MEPDGSAPVTTKGLGRRTVAGISWTLLGSIGSNLLRIAVIAILGRLLSKHDFGVVAAAMIVIAFAGKLRDAGIGLALVQRKDLTREHVETCFAFTVLYGAALGALIFLIAGPVSSALAKPESADVIRVLAVLFVMRGVTATSQFLCHRDLQFRALAMVDLVAYGVGSGVSIGCAFAGMGAWSLVVGYLVETSIDMVLMLWLRPPPVPRFHRAALRDLLGFGTGQTLAGLANYFATQGDYIVVGRYFDTATLGIYTRAHELMRFPAVVFSTVAGKVLFSSFARLQDEPARLAQAFRRTLFANAIVLLPASAGLIVLAPEAVRILLGPGWDDAVVPFQIMAASMLWRTSHKAASIVARSAGDVFAIAAWQVVYAVAVIGGGIVSVRWGIAGVACTTAAAVFFHFTNLTRLALRRVPIRWGEVIAAHGDGAVLAVLATAGALPAALGLRALELGALPIAVGGTLAGLVPAVAYAVWRRRRSADLAWLVDRVRELGKKKKRGQKKKRKADAALTDTREAPP
jgi:PST family polysaccharide transporter